MKFTVLFACSASEVSSALLRSRAQASLITRESYEIAKMNSTSVAPILEVVDKSELTKSESANCLCPLGQFWHWRIHACVDQGGWGYECGFFPGEHHHRVCQDGLKCQPLKSGFDNYISYGMYQGTANSFPASC